MTVVLRQHKHYGWNIQVAADPSGYPVWGSEVEPGSSQDITAACTHVLLALYPAAGAGLPTLTDKSYTGADMGTQVTAQGLVLVSRSSDCRN